MTSDSNHLYAATRNQISGVLSAHIYLSTDQGSTWNCTNFTAITNHFVRAMALQGSILYAAVDFVGLFRSDDFGQTWSQVSILGIGNLDIRVLSVVGSDVYAGADNTYLFCSRDSGATWTNTGLGGGISSVAGNGPLVFSGTQLGMEVSTDSGQSWHVMNNGFPTTPGVTSIVLFAGNIYAVANYCIFISTDTGQTWNFMSNVLTAFLDGPLKLVANGNDLFVTTFWRGIYTSSDSGLNWSQIDTTQYYPVNNKIESCGPDLWLGNAKGIYRSTDQGTTWHLSNDGMINTTIVSVLSFGNKIFAAGSNYAGLFVSDDNGNSWTPTDSGMTLLTQCQTIFKDGSNILVGTFDEGIYISSDSGISWVQSNNGFGAWTDPNVYCFTQIGNRIIAGTMGGGPYISDDHGQHWSVSNNGLENSFVHRLLTVDSNVFASVEDSGMCVSTDSGATWHSINNGLNILTFQTLEYDGTQIYGAYGYGASDLYVGANQGGLWTQLNIPLIDSAIQVLHYNNDLLFAGTMGEGIFYTPDHGLSWDSLNIGLTDSYVLSMDHNASNLFAGTFNSGVFINSNLPTSIRDHESTIHAIRIYPNPFKDYFVLSNDNPISNGMVSIYTMTGNKIYEKAIGTIAAHQPVRIPFSPSPGFYIIRLCDGIHSYNQKVVVTN
jgi:photosystem II stability/assembly factor-like uncharacterized protein